VSNVFSPGSTEAESVDDADSRRGPKGIPSRFSSAPICVHLRTNGGSKRPNKEEETGSQDQQDNRPNSSILKIP
ncbi:MAG TPA: hypothetical protein PLA90_18125, partial [Candidatus Sumerlaeota bacterium]|nr:hypothetical protein [Candidatus Sumerlaeota bacterium]